MNMSFSFSLFFVPSHNNRQMYVIVSKTFSNASSGAVRVEKNHNNNNSNNKIDDYNNNHKNIADNKE